MSLQMTPQLTIDEGQQPSVPAAHSTESAREPSPGDRFTAPPSSPVRRGDVENRSARATYTPVSAATVYDDIGAVEVERRQVRAWQDAKRPKFTMKQEWIGRVDEIRDDSFIATLSTRERHGQFETAELELEEVSPADVEKVRLGAMFCWVIGYRDEPYGQRIGVSTIQFRNMIDPSDVQIAEADAEAVDAVVLTGPCDSA